MSNLYIAKGINNNNGSMEDHKTVQILNHTPRTNGRYPELVKTSKAVEQETTYNAALELIARIDEDLTRGIRHYRTKAGVLLNTLDEVVRAILDDNLLVPEEQENVWVARQELAA